MAKYDVQCRQCGAEMTVQLFGPHRTREWKIDHYDWQCDACKEAAKQAATEAAARAAAEAGLPELEGSEKQVAWAETIRQKFVDEADKYRKMYDTMDPEEAKDHREKFENAVSDILGRTSARFWIDNRTTDARTLIIDAAEALMSRPKQQAAAAVAEDAKAEVTIRPAKILTETRVEITIIDRQALHANNRIEVRFPERREDFWNIIKKEFRFVWKTDHWERPISYKIGDGKNLCAQLGNRLLSSGFPIVCFDDEVRRMAVDGTFTPEQRRWVARNTVKYDGWFAISWDRSDADFYKEAMSLPGARYHNGYVVVPPEQYEEVIGFAEIHGFSFSPGAAALIESLRAAREKAFVAEVTAPKKSRKPKAIQPDPGPAGVDDDLRDN